MGTYKTQFAKDNDLIVKDSSGSTSLIASATGLLYSEGVPIFMPSTASTNFDPYRLETISWSSGGLDVSTATPYGITFIDANSAAGDPSTSPATLTLAAPLPGVKKTIIIDTTVAYINTIDVALSGATLIGTSGDNYIAFSSLGTATQSVSLIGITTALWGVESCNSTLLFFGAATGIRSATAARTS